jgi:hypothetical protein
MSYVLAISPPGAEKTYYAGPKRHGIERTTELTTRLLDRATKFDTAEEADEMRKELAAGYQVVDASQ